MSKTVGYPPNKSSRSVLSDAFLPMADAKFAAYATARQQAAEETLQRQIDEHREITKSKRPFILGMDGCS